MKSEHEFQKKVLKQLRELPYSHVEKISQLAERGTLDIVVCLRGKYVAIECKRSKADASPTKKGNALQIYKANQIKKAKGKAYIVYPENWDFIYQKLRLIR